MASNDVTCATVSSDSGFTETTKGFVDSSNERIVSNIPQSATTTNAAENRTSHRKAYVSVAILCFINLINYMDRYTIASVLTDVKSYYNLNDSEAGLLQTAFVVSYMIMAPIFGYLGDRYKRSWIMVGGILFWSTTTFLGSFVPSAYFGWFIFLRALVGTGEASYSTIAPTIIADLFAGQARTRMLSLFYFAIPVGSGLGYIVGAQVANLFGHWYWALRISPALGVLSVVLLLLFLREPPRGESEGGIVLKNTSVFDDIVQVIKVPSFMWVTLGFTCVTFSVGALAWWVPDFIVSAIKVNGGSPDQATINLIFGVITCFAGIFGVILGSGSAALYRKVNSRADPLICFYSMLAATPFVFIGCVVAEYHISATYVLIFFGVTLLCVNWVLVTDITLYVIIPTRRSIASAIQITLSHALGDACSPYVVGAISDSIRAERSLAKAVFRSMEYALFLPIFVLLIGSVCFLINSYYVEEDKDKCTRIIHSGSPQPPFADRMISPIDNNTGNMDVSRSTVNLID